MGMKFAADIAKEIEGRGPIAVPGGYVTGEAYEEWLYGGDAADPQAGEGCPPRPAMEGEG